MAHLPYNLEEEKADFPYNLINDKDGCTLDQRTTLYKDTRYIKVHDLKSDISLHQLE